MPEHVDQVFEGFLSRHNPVVVRVVTGVAGQKLDFQSAVLNPPALAGELFSVFQGRQINNAIGLQKSPFDGASHDCGGVWIGNLLVPDPKLSLMVGILMYKAKFVIKKPS